MKAKTKLGFRAQCYMAGPAKMATLQSKHKRGKVLKSHNFNMTRPDTCQVLLRITELSLPVFEGPSASHALQPFFGVWITTRSRVLETSWNTGKSQRHRTTFCVNHSDCKSQSHYVPLLCVSVLHSLWFVWGHLRLSTITGFAALAPLWPSSSRAQSIQVWHLMTDEQLFSGIRHASQRQSWHSQSGAKQGSTSSKHTKNVKRRGKTNRFLIWCYAWSKQLRTGFYAGNGTMARSKSHPWPPSHGFCLKSRALVLQTWNESRKSPDAMQTNQRMKKKCYWKDAFCKMRLSMRSRNLCACSLCRKWHLRMKTGS